MHIKSKFELNFVHIAVLAVCPFMLLVSNFQIGLTLMTLSIVSFLCTALITLLFFKKSSKNIRIFISALISSLVVCGYEYFTNQGMFADIGEIAYFSILSTIILCIDTFYVDSKLSTTNYLLKMIRLLSIYSLVSIIYFVLKELLSYGTISGIKIIANFEGYEFFKLITFDLILLGLLCSVINRISAIFIEMHNDKTMVYNKYKMKVRNEKVFIYEQLRRKKLLTSDVEIINVKDTEDEDKQEDNIESIEIEKTDELPENLSQEKTKKDKAKPRKKSKFKISKEAKVEKVFDRASDRKEGNNNA